ncbi:MAG: DUF2256 and DUF3253 domain-containing protein [Pseudomonadota bacterium]
MSERAPKVCERCGREITWRKKWARDWDQIKYCSKACRKTGLTSNDRDLEAAILAILAKRGQKTMCPSEAAKAVGGEDWRALNEAARNAARRLVARDKIRIMQNNREVDPSRAKGPIRLRLR